MTVFGAGTSQPKPISLVAIVGYLVGLGGLAFTLNEAEYRAAKHATIEEASR